MSKMAVKKISETSCMNLRQNQETFDDDRNKIEKNIKSSSIKFNPLLSFTYIFLSAISFGLLSVSVKKIPYINTSQLALIRNVGVFIGALPIAVYVNRRNFVGKQDRYFLLLRGFVSATAYYMIIIAYKCLPLAEAAIIFSSQQFLTAALARIYLKETFGWILTISLIVNILGILASVRLPEILINRTTGNNFQVSSIYLGGLAAAFAAILLRALSTVFIRKLKHVHFSMGLLYAGFIGLIENTIITATAFSFDSSDCGWDQILCMSVGLFGFLESAWHFSGFQKQPAGLSSVERSSLNVLILTLFQILIFQEYPDNYVILGVCLVILSLGIVGFKTWLVMLPKESAIRRKLKFFEN